MEGSPHFLPALQLPGLTESQSLIVEYTWLVMGIAIVSIGFVALTMRTVPKGLQGFVELIISFLEGFIVDVVGHNGLKFFSLIGSIFVFILVSNYIGLVPGCIAPTGDINTTAACAIVVFIFYNIVGIKAQGFKYFKRFLGPIPALAPIMVIMETISEFARPFSLAVRLYANIMGGHLILGLFYAVPIVLPAIWMTWESVLTAPIQSFVFSLLTMIYLGGAISEEH